MLYPEYMQSSAGSVVVTATRATTPRSLKHNESTTKSHAQVSGNDVQSKNSNGHLVHRLEDTVVRGLRVINDGNVIKRPLPCQCVTS